jgi:DNA-directed RNA polymerase subunit L
MSVSSKFISNLKYDNESITFDLNNKNKELKISFVNALRRTIISDIYTYAIDDKSIKFYENTSMLNNEFLKHRLTLIPIVSNLENIHYDNIIISCKKKNENENMENIYVRDFTCIDSDSGKSLDSNLLFKYMDILFAKIKYGQSISFECRLTRSNSYYKGSFFSPVSVCLYTFKIDDEEVKNITSHMNEKDKKTFFTQDIERIYKKNDVGEPYIYHFKLESIGFYDAKDIFIIGCIALKERLNHLKDEFRNKKSTKITIVNDGENDFFKFLIDHENETIGNLLSTYITYNPSVFYCGYVIEHPLKKNILFKIRLHEKNDLENNIQVIENMIDYLVSLLDKLLNEFS